MDMRILCFNVQLYLLVVNDFDFESMKPWNQSLIQKAPFDTTLMRLLYQLTVTLPPLAHIHIGSGTKGMSRHFKVSILKCLPSLTIVYLIEKPSLWECSECQNFVSLCACNIMIQKLFTQLKFNAQPQDVLFFTFLCLVYYTDHSLVYQKQWEGKDTRENWLKFFTLIV